MKKFNKLFTTETKVIIAGEYGYRFVKSINDSRTLIEVDGVCGSFQRGHIITFTNKANVEMYPALDDLYVTDQYDSVYERKSDANHFVGKLQGRTLAQFVKEIS